MAEVRVRRRLVTINVIGTCDKSTDRRRILQSAVGPQCVLAARQFKLRCLANVAFEHLAIVSDQLGNPIRPIIAEPQHLAYVSRVLVQVVLRRRTSTSPPCNGLKRSLVATGTKATFFVSL